MPTYRYMARDVSGVSTEGEVDSATKFEALSLLQSRGLTVVRIEEEGIKMRGNSGTAATERQAGRLSLGGVSLTEKAMFCRQFAISVASGVPLREALETIMLDMENKNFQAVLERVLRRLEDGLPFSQAIAPEGKVFDRLFVALIKAAEESGSMPATLNYLAAALEKSDRLARKIKSIMAYPVFVAVFFVIVAAIMTLFVLPRFQEIFASYGSSLPLLTRIVLKVNTFILSNLLVLFLVLVALVVSLVFYARTTAGRLQMDNLILRLPFFGDVARKMAVARFTRNLGIMIKGGVPVATAIEIASGILDNKAMEISLLESHRRIVSGGDIASSLDKKVFPRLVVRMVGVGETSGRLPEVLDRVADVYEDQVEGAVMVATALFEPLVIVLFGCIILVLVMAIYLPVFSVAASVR